MTPSTVEFVRLPRGVSTLEADWWRIRDWLRGWVDHKFSLSPHTYCTLFSVIVLFSRVVCLGWRDLPGVGGGYAVARVVAGSVRHMRA